MAESTWDAWQVVAALAPDGIVGENGRRLSLLDIYCRCKELLIRVVPAPAGVLVVTRKHNPPMARHLAVKGEAWDGRRQEARVIHDERGSRVADDLGFHIGWYDDAVWLDDDRPFGMETLHARCRCGRYLQGRPGQVADVVRSLLANRIRRTSAPADLLLTRDEHLELVLEEATAAFRNQGDRGLGAPQG